MKFTPKAWLLTLLLGCLLSSVVDAQSARKKRWKSPRAHRGDRGLVLRKLKWRQVDTGGYTLGLAYKVSLPIMAGAASRSYRYRSGIDPWLRSGQGCLGTDLGACRDQWLREMLLVSDNVSRAIESVRVIQSVGGIQLVAGVRFGEDALVPVPVDPGSPLTLHLTPTIERSTYILNARMNL